MAVAFVEYTHEWYVQTYLINTVHTRTARHGEGAAGAPRRARTHAQRTMATSAHLDLALAAFRGAKRRNRVEPLDVIASVKAGGDGEGHAHCKAWRSGGDGLDIYTMEFACVSMWRDGEAEERVQVTYNVTVALQYGIMINGSGENSGMYIELIWSGAEAFVMPQRCEETAKVKLGYVEGRMDTGKGQAAGRRLWKLRRKAARPGCRNAGG